jgi:hypothetical protein
MLSPRGAGVLFLLLLLVAAITTRADDTPRQITVDDLLHLKTIGGAEISPDGGSIVYGVTEADFDQDAYVSNLWLARAAGGAPIQLTRDRRVRRQLRPFRIANRQVISWKSTDGTEIEGGLETSPMTYIRQARTITCGAMPCRTSSTP